MPEDAPEQDPIGGDARFAELDARLKAATKTETIKSGDAAPGPDKGYRQGSRILADLIAGPVGGGLIGWLFDGWFGTSPWLLLAFGVLGTAGAFWNIVKISSQRPE